MTEAVEILIKADDKASQKFAEVSANAGKASQKTGNAFKEMGGRAKATTEFVGTLASLTGNTELAGLASMIAGATEKASAFSEVAKAGGAGATAFKLGLMGLAATVGAVVGKALGDIIFETDKFERSLANAKDQAAELDSQLQKTQASIFAMAREDIELIRDPEEKRAAYKAMFNDLNRDISTAAANVEKSKQAVEEWAAAWQITGERKAQAVMAGEQLEEDKEKLAMLKAQRDEVAKLVSVRAQENEQIRKANAAKDKSDEYLDALRKEVEYLGAAREEQIKLDAIRNTTEQGRGEAEALLKERDALLAKAEAEKEAERLQEQAAKEKQNKQEQEAKRIDDLKKSEAERIELQRIELEQGKEASRTQDLINQGLDASLARQFAAQEAANEAMKEKKTQQEQELQKIEDLKKSESERIELQRIEIEQGKQAAKVQELINAGIDKATAQKLAAKEAKNEAMKEEQKLLEKESKGDAKLSATESRLLTRGPADQQSRWMEDAARNLRRIMESTIITADATAAANEKLGFIDENTSNTLQMVPVA